MVYKLQLFKAASASTDELHRPIEEVTQREIIRMTFHSNERKEKKSQFIVVHCPESLSTDGQLYKFDQSIHLSI